MSRGGKGAARVTGTLGAWDSKKACGFIDVAATGKRIFAHKSDFEFQFDDTQGPQLGSTLNFVPGNDPKSGKERATQIRSDQGKGHSDRGRNSKGGGAYVGGGYGGGYDDGYGKGGGYGYGGYGGYDGYGGGAYGGGYMGGPMGGCGGGGGHWEFRPLPGMMENLWSAGPAYRQAPQANYGSSPVAPSRGMIPRCRGTLQEWNEQKACGFIETPDGKRIFAHKSDFVEQFADNRAPSLGTPVAFVLGADPKSGKQRAQTIQLETSKKPFDSQRLQGTLAEWNPKKACGFIQGIGPAGKRFFAHKSEFAVPFGDGEDPPIGTPVSFVFGVDARSGRERAQDIRMSDGEEDIQSGGERRSRGTLSDWKSEKACGFVEGTDGKRWFAHKTEFAEPFAEGETPEVGSAVTFLPGVDSKSGRERATDIRFGDDDTPIPPRRSLGIVSDWKVEKACGFIESDGKRWFAHKTEFAEPFEEGVMPEVGNAVTFVPGVDSKSGRERATDIKFEGEDGLDEDDASEGMSGPVRKRARKTW